MGQVHRAHDTRLNRTVAIKVLHPDATASLARRQRFLREAHAAAALTHPHICALYDVGTENGIDYLVLEYLQGETLAVQAIMDVTKDIARAAWTASAAAGTVVTV